MDTEKAIMSGRDSSHTQGRDYPQRKVLSNTTTPIARRTWLRIILFGFGAGYWASFLLWTIQEQKRPSPTFLDESNCMPDVPLLSKSKASFLGASSTSLSSSSKNPSLTSNGGDKIQQEFQEPPTPRQPLMKESSPHKIAKNATTLNASVPLVSNNKEDKKERKPPSPTWWKRFVPSLANAWQPRSVDSWCSTLEQHPPTPFLLGRGEVAEGMIYIKTYKASSSTCEGIAWSIAHHVGQRQRNKLSASTTTTTSSVVTPVCKAYTRHEFADNRMHARRHPTQSLLWTFVRNPAARDLSHVYHFEIGRLHRTDMTSLDIRRQIQTRIKGRQTRYLIPTKTSRAPLWPLHELRKNKTELISYMKSEIFENYDFLGLTERMTDSLAVMVLLWDLQPQDVVVLNSKRSGGFDDGGHNDTCTVIPKAVMTPELQEYFETKHPLWNADVLLYHAANASLQMTIDALGRDRVQHMAETIKRLQQRAQDLCLGEAFFPCSANGTFQLELAEQSCYVQDAGCGHECVDRVLSAAAG